MKNVLKLLIICIITIVISGCLNLTEHLYYGQVTTVYEPTCIVWRDGVCVWWSENAKKHPIPAYIVKITYPFWIVDFPCEVVLDTLTFPYDLYKKYDHPHNRSINEKTIYHVTPETSKE